MTKMVRIIPRLDIKGPNLVKGIHLEGLRVLGRPEDYALKYYNEGADELIYMDVVASLYGRNALYDIVKRTAENVFIPLTVGGGIRKIEDIREMLRAGADKVAINTAAVKNPHFISEAARIFGSQCIVVSIESKKKEEKYEVYTDNGREKTGIDVFDWARRAVELGAGELLVTSIDNEGTGRGFDTDLTLKISEFSSVPVISCGGAGSKEDFSKIVLEGKADAVCASSVFHYHYISDIFSLKNIDNGIEGNKEFLKCISSGGLKRGNIKSCSIKDLKNYLTQDGIDCRIH